jgi:hypothetical protein
LPVPPGLYRFARRPRPLPWVRRGALATLCLFILLGLVPLRGGDMELKLPVSYARVKLPARAPLTVQLPLPPGEYTVEPASLGYFNEHNEFIYTADEPRGLIFARSGEKVVLVELQAPAQAEEFINDYLAAIRGGVAELNRQENQLLLTRQQYSARSSRAKQLASIPLSMGSDELAAGAIDEWCARCLGEGAAILGEAPLALNQSAPSSSASTTKSSRRVSTCSCATSTCRWRWRGCPSRASPTCWAVATSST